LGVAHSQDFRGKVLRVLKEPSQRPATGRAADVAARVRAIVAAHASSDPAALGDLIYESFVHRLVVRQARKVAEARNDQRWADDVESLACFRALSYCRRLDPDRVDSWACQLFTVVHNAVGEALRAAKPGGREPRHLVPVEDLEDDEEPLAPVRARFVVIPLDPDRFEAISTAPAPDDVAVGGVVAGEIQSWLHSGAVAPHLEGELSGRLRNPRWNGDVPVWMANRVRGRVPDTLRLLAGVPKSAQAEALWAA
jgi:hypothetical protein